MNMLHAINSTNPRGGGPIEAILQAHRALSGQGHAMEVVCLDHPDAEWLKALPLKIHALGPAYSMYRFAPRCRPWLRANMPTYDCVIVHGVWRYVSCAVRQAARAAGTPYFVYTHGMMDPAHKQLFPVKHLLKSVTWQLVEQRVMRDARAVFFTCEEERRLAHQSFRPLVCADAIVPYCVGEPPGDVKAQTDAFYQRFPGLRNKRVLLFLSRIHPKKGCDILLEAFAGLADEDESLYLVMAGPDAVGWQRELERKARDLGVGERVVWTGMLTGDLKWGAFRAAEVFVLPSHQENFGIAVVEALACGVPVLISSRINIWREIEADGAGIVTPDDAQGAASALRTWMQKSDDEKRLMRMRAGDCFGARFRSREAAENLLDTVRCHGFQER